MFEPSSLAEWYSRPWIERALDAYAKRSKSLAWAIDHKLGLYGAAARAFDHAVHDSERSASFFQIYDSFHRYWQVFRPQPLEECWGAERVREELDRVALSEYVEGEGLPGVRRPAWEHIYECARRFRDIKPNQHFPTMTVSKFLHFRNPSLFPIYDTAVIWNEVFARFRPDYEEFCDQWRLDADAWGAGFIANYVCWAADCIQNADLECMETFAEWLRAEVPEQAKQLEAVRPLTQLYATAFEFIAIGAVS